MRASFVLLAFNQERFIEEAICSAFAQEWSDLEIILSDDCSTDRTFQIMSGLASRYSGPHKVIVNRNECNIGTSRHVYRASSLASGEIILLAAADDISLPHRTQRTVEAWKSSGADALWSRYEVIDDNGNTIQDDHSVDNINFSILGRPSRNVHGASSAYSARVFRTIPEPRNNILFEDIYLSIMIQSLGWKTEKIEERLVKYRRHPDSISNFRSGLDPKSVLKHEERLSKYSRSFYDMLLEFEERFGKNPLLSRDMRYHLYRSTWLERGVASRMRGIFSLRSPAHIRWALARLFGVSSLVFMRRIASLGLIKAS